MQSINIGAGKAEKPPRQNNQRLTRVKPSVNTTWCSSQRKFCYFSPILSSSHWGAELPAGLNHSITSLSHWKSNSVVSHWSCEVWDETCTGKAAAAFNWTSSSLVGRDRDVWRSILFPHAPFLYEEPGFGLGCTSELLQLGQDQLFKQSRNDVSSWHRAENTVKNPGYVGTLWGLTFL